MTVAKLAEEEIFNVARKIDSPEARAEYIRQVCQQDDALRGRVESLLQVHEQEKSFLRPPSPVATSADVAAECPGTAIGPYKLLEQIGEGGMGTVWMAQQHEPVKRLVALKLIRAGMDSKQVIARFEAERQALALMDHTNIARVLDGGTTSAGRPYFIMDLVKGVPITRYCDEHHLTPRQRLELFMPVCQAVQHAHQKGIIHRDIKPSNVLVALYDGKPVPKVIDFGVAKAAGQSLTDKTLVTGFGNIVGTLEYMSPEQAEVNQLDIDTRSDIYSLGVLLYELLTGTTPLEHRRAKQAGLLEALRIIREEETQRPSARLSTVEELPTVAANRGSEPKKLSALFRGELDWIVLKALEKNRSRRYESANDLARDVQRYLADEPVLACPPSAGYRLRKFARRHAGALAASGAFVLLLVTAVVTLSVALVAVTRERREKEAALEAEGKRRQQARAALDDLSSQLVGDWLAQQTALSPEYRKFLQRALRSYEEFAEDTGQDEPSRDGVAQAYWRIGRIRHRLGQHQEAEAALLRSRDLHTRLADDFPGNPTYRVNLAQVYFGLNVLYINTGQHQKAEIVSGQGLTLCRQLTEDFPQEAAGRLGLARALNLRGTYLLTNSRPGEAEAVYREALGVLDGLAGGARAHPEARGELAQTHMSLGLVLRHTGRGREALGYHEKVVALDRQLVEQFPDQPDQREALARGLTNLGNLLDELERRPEAEAAWRETLTIQRRLVAGYPGVPVYRTGLAMIVGNLASVRKSEGRYGEAEELYREALALFRQLADADPTHPGHRNDVAGAMVNLAGLLTVRKDFLAARRLLDEALPHHQAALNRNPHHPTYRRYYRINRERLAETLLELQDHAAAAEVTGQFLKAAVDPPRDAYTAACLLAGCVRLAARDAGLPEARRAELATTYGNRAMAALRQAVAKQASEVAQMKTDSDLDPLRQRQDFQKLLAGLEAKGKP
jgi:serine/threonine protein kinase/tetratricopeptide (TPR) repeat protein